MSPRWGSTPRLTEWLTVSRTVTLTLTIHWPSVAMWLRFENSQSSAGVPSELLIKNWRVSWGSSRRWWRRHSVFVKCSNKLHKNAINPINRKPVYKSRTLPNMWQYFPLQDQWVRWYSSVADATYIKSVTFKTFNEFFWDNQLCQLIKVTKVSGVISLRIIRIWSEPFGSQVTSESDDGNRNFRLNIFNI
jgi:hypothetical protein